ncbi:SDR family NAD(P)-dependent oxidoreductase [Micromonospora sp. B9E7]|uniref:SDR family NAD(P)-dependent oxidoreductase n=1 Tax=Micromonospora sp. B9E7 TaxID=3153574 RepID=UPI00325E9743
MTALPRLKTTRKGVIENWLLTGCTSGFGQRLALAGAQRGDQVIAAAHGVKTIVEMAEPFGGRMITLPLDVTDAAAANAAVATAVETFGGFDEAVDADEAPLHLPLSPIAYSIAERKLAALRSDIDARRDITIATDFDQP